VDKIKVAIVGGSGYTGGELLRLLLSHPRAEVVQVTSERSAGKLVSKAHPNLRKRTQLQFSKMAEIRACDLLFLCLPHGEAMEKIRQFQTVAPKIIDLSADFRLQTESAYQEWYGKRHACPELLGKFVYGIPELHREAMRGADLISSAGCNATVTILGLYPFYKSDLIDPDRTVVEVKVGSSEAGNAPSASSHHPERSGAVRSFMPTRHRHTGEVIQELSFGRPIQVHMSVTSIELVRGALATSHLFLKQKLEDKDVWKIFRQAYGQEPFIRIVKEADGTHRYPEPKWLAGTNYCDIGFERDEKSQRLVIISAIDNLMKGAAGQAVQAFNIMHGFTETEGLDFPGLHPV
jgi:[amino group carrier protein]-6-phospho-L-2-aminoadipate/5-phospho-L-glutamate reductase